MEQTLLLRSKRSKTKQKQKKPPELYYFDSLAKTFYGWLSIRVILTLKLISSTLEQKCMRSESLWDHVRAVAMQIPEHGQPGS